MLVIIFASTELKRKTNNSLCKPQEKKPFFPQISCCLFLYLSLSYSEHNEHCFCSSNKAPHKARREACGRGAPQAEPEAWGKCLPNTDVWLIGNVWGVGTRRKERGWWMLRKEERQTWSQASRFWRKSLANMEFKEVCQTVLKWSIKLLKDSWPKFPAFTLGQSHLGRGEAGLWVEFQVLPLEARQLHATLTSEPVYCVLVAPN